MSTRFTTRRAFLARSTTLGVAAWTATHPLSAWAALFEPSLTGDLQDGEKLGAIPFVGEQRDKRRRERITGSGLGGRYRVDLSTLTDDTLVIPNDRFYIRTRCPDRIDYTQPWTIRIHGLVEQEGITRAADIVQQSQPMGVHLLECAGSGNGGLISAAEWSGVPIGEVLDTVTPKANATRILVSGFDDHSRYNESHDERGADWIFTREQLDETGAFLATHINGEVLPQDHGFPVRLVVPGWYGCTCIKWLDEIKFVADGARATRHMRHYAGRTHQRGIPTLAREYRPAEIDLTASPVRVEKWRVDGRIVYRVVGTVWGGKQTTDKLVIRFKADERYVPVQSYDHKTVATWSLWSHTWRPSKPDRYIIQLQVDDPAIRTRRLDSGYYRRAVDIEEV